MTNPIFQRRHYEATAATIKATAERIETNWREHGNEKLNQLCGVRRTAAHFAEMFAQDNPRFDAGRFLTACGYGATTMNPRDPALDLRPLPGERSTINGQPVVYTENGFRRL